MNITVETAKKFGQELSAFRDRLKAEISIAQRNLGWTQVETAKRFGRKEQDKPYTKSYINQLINVHKGKEEHSIKLYEFLRGYTDVSGGSP